MAVSSTTFAAGHEKVGGRTQDEPNARKTKLQGDLLEIEKDLAEGRLCKADDVKDTYAQFIRAVKATLDALGPQASTAVATALKLDSDGLLTVSDAIRGQIDAARAMIVKEWTRIGADNSATR